MKMKRQQAEELINKRLNYSSLKSRSSYYINKKRQEEELEKKKSLEKKDEATPKVEEAPKPTETDKNEPVVEEEPQMDSFFRDSHLFK